MTMNFLDSLLVSSVVFAAACGSDPTRPTTSDSVDAGPGSATSASCEGITCWSPPPPACNPNGTLEVPAPGGYCTNGECAYATRSQTCSVGTCQGGQCSASSCEGVTCNHPPSTECVGSHAVLVYAQLGTCAAGTCSYATRAQTCETGTCNVGVCGASTCEGVYCDKPPARYCADESTLVVFAPGGVCTSASGMAECRHGSKQFACSDRCEDGHCVNDACLGISCTVPPASYCSGDQLVVFEPNGRCDEGSCVYGSHREACENGCIAGQCVGDPCAGVVCATTPAAYCVDGATLRTYRADTCDQGTCVYEHEDVQCENGCNNGGCVGEACSGVTCNAPPANACVSDAELRAWDGQPGACVGGECQYGTKVIACSGGCEAGQCVGEPCVGVSCASAPADRCVDGATLVRYSGTAGTCEGGACSYASEAVTCPGLCEAGKCAENVDECATGAHDCDENATCVDTDGGYACDCNAGYEGDGTTCEPVTCSYYPNVGSPCDDCVNSFCHASCIAIEQESTVDAFLSCLNGCASAQCMADCEQQYPSAAVGADELTVCMESNCNSECGYCMFSSSDPVCDQCWNTDCQAACYDLTWKLNTIDYQVCVQPCLDQACYDECELLVPGTGAAKDGMNECVASNCPSCSWTFH